MFIQYLCIAIDNYTVSLFVNILFSFRYVVLSLSANFLLIFAGLLVNSLMLRLKAKELSSDPEFKASLGWYTNWKRRHAISMRAKTTLAQRLPADMEEKVIEFHRFVLRSRQRCSYEPSHILNMDETPMRFELPATRTLEFTGNRTVPILSCGGISRVLLLS